MHFTQKIAAKSSTDFSAVPVTKNLKKNGLSSLKTIPNLDKYQVIQNNGTIVNFDPSKIFATIIKAFLTINNQLDVISPHIYNIIINFTDDIVSKLIDRHPNGYNFYIKDIQDQVHLILIESNNCEVARAYISLHQIKNSKTAKQQSSCYTQNIQATQLRIIKAEGQSCLLDIQEVRMMISAACVGLEKHVNVNTILLETIKNLYNDAPIEELYKSAILAARTLMEKDPAYSQVTARLLMHIIRKEVFGKEVAQTNIISAYQNYFAKYIYKGIKANLLDPRLAEFNLTKLTAAIKPERDLKFSYLGLQTLYDRYFLRIENICIEMPQIFYMRVAMGLSLNEDNREIRTIEFYNLLSSFDFMSSTPTLFNSGTLRSQLSSCYLTTVADDLGEIYEAIKENALLAKYAGGLGNDWTPVRSLGAHIKGTNGKSQGVVPFLKVVNDTAVAVNQGGKRKGAVCVYLETWHMDIEEFLELRKNTGDDRRRTHDMNTANWIPDLFMKRVIEKGQWTLFSPSDTLDLHDTFGEKFEKIYIAYEDKAARGELKLFKKIQAIDLWRKMLSMLFETGHPWITFKDPCNIRSPQQHIGIVHSSNLCTEITLNTSEIEIAVCNLGSINLPAHLINGEINYNKLQKTIRIAMRMLDNVIDINYYAVKKTRDSNLRHRPVGLGIMGFQDCLHIKHIPYASAYAIEFADHSMEAVCYYAYLASTELAEERGCYNSYSGSLWNRGILPQDSLKLLAKERGKFLKIDTSETLDWTILRSRIAKFGMRNSNCVAIAPTATISNIIDVSACIEPTYQNLYVKSNLSGEFTEINKYLVQDLKKLGLWDENMISDLKYFDGSVKKINRIPEDLREIYATAFEIDPSWLIKAASRRQKWIDQAQSLNIYIANASGKYLDETYKLAWLYGLKTTYYLRTMGATNTEKSTSKTRTLNAVTIDSNINTTKTSTEISTVNAMRNSNIFLKSHNSICNITSNNTEFEECETCQ